jgi:DNA-binding IclR family transcriptional regulator
MELTSLGRAWLAQAPEATRKALLAHFRRVRGAQWKTLGAEIAAAMASVTGKGWCAASWQPEVVAVATPLVVDGLGYALNVSVSTAESLEETVGGLASVLLALKARIEHAVAVESGG